MPEIYSAKARKVRRPASIQYGTANVSQEDPMETTSDSQHLQSSASNNPAHSHSHRNVDEYSLVMQRESVCNNPFAAYSPKPLHVKFETQSAREHVILVLRRHPITNLPWIFIALLLAVAPTFLQYSPFTPFIPSQFVLFIMIGWYLLIIGYALESFLSWYFNVNIISDERIVDIDFHSLIAKRISSAKIDNIEDVTSETVGFIRSFLDFGKVLIQTAAEQKEFEFIDVPHPDRVVQLINELVLEEEREKLEGRVM